MNRQSRRPDKHLFCFCPRSGALPLGISALNHPSLHRRGAVMDADLSPLRSPLLCLWVAVFFLCTLLSVPSPLGRTLKSRPAPRSAPVALPSLAPVPAFLLLCFYATTGPSSGSPVVTRRRLGAGPGHRAQRHPFPCRDRREFDLSLFSG